MEPELVRVKYLTHYAEDGNFMEFNISDHLHTPIHFSAVHVSDADAAGTPHSGSSYTIIRSSSNANNGLKLNKPLRQHNDETSLRGDILIVHHKPGEPKLFSTIRAADVEQIVQYVANILVFDY